MLSNRHGLYNLKPDIFVAPFKENKKIDIFIGYKFDNTQVDDFFENKLKPLIEDLLRKYSPVKDSVSSANFKFDNTILTNILTQIDGARMAIIDLTDHSYNVYYEAGILKGKEIPVIFTAHSKEKGTIPFDVNNFHVFYWDEEIEEEFLKSIRKCILQELN
jgi:hypothetical protein